MSTRVPVHRFTSTSQNLYDSLLPYVSTCAIAATAATECLILGDDNETNEVNQVVNLELGHGLLPGSRF